MFKIINSVKMAKSLVIQLTSLDVSNKSVQETLPSRSLPESPISPFSLGVRYASFVIVRASLFSAILVSFASKVAGSRPLWLLLQCGLVCLLCEVVIPVVGGSLRS